MKTIHTAFILFISIFCCDVSTSYAYTSQEIINALTQAGQAYWEQRVVIDHTSTGKTFFGFSGVQTVKEEGVTRYYDTDGTFVTDPHIFVEAEDSKGPAGVLFAYVKAYEATGNKFFLRAAKSLGDTLIQAQNDNNTGGWWHDMGVMADGVDLGQFVNYFPWGGSVHADPEFQHIGDNDGASYLQATALLRLEQALPAGDPDKGGKYLAGAKWYADTLVALKDVTLVRDGTTYHPYGNGGIPQMFPFATVNDGRRPVDFCKNCTFPDDYPEGFKEYSHNSMITLNDDAMLGAVFFLGEFALEAKTNAGLDEMTYLTAGRLNIDYLLDRFTALAVPSGNSGWATAYYIQDGSANAGKPTWLRSMEPPGFYAQSSADDILVNWYKNIETDPARLAAINSTMAQHALFWKNDAKVVNGDQAYIDIVAGDHTGDDAGSDPVLTGPARNWTKADASYDLDNAHTWYFWYVANHDSATGAIGLPVSGPDPLKCKPTGDNCYNRTVGLSAVYRRNLTNGDFYSYSEAGYPPLIGSSMGTSPPSHEIAMFLDEANNGYDWDNNSLEYYHVYDPDRRFFYKHPYSSSKVDGALNDLDEETKFFLPREVMIFGTVYPVIHDNFFTERFSALAWGINNGATGEVVDSDGDGYSDTEETTAGSDIFDSESAPGTTRPGTLIPQYLLLLRLQVITMEKRSGQQINPLISVVALSILSILITGCSFSHHAMALFSSTDHFIQVQGDSRVLFEPGAEKHAQKISTFLELAIQQIEERQYRPFPKPVQVYVCASRKSFKNYFGADVSAGVTSKLFLSPRVFDQGDEIARLYLIHELSHLHLLQFLGSYKMRRLPFWFKEGLATYASGGGGANKVSEEEALAAFHIGKYFIPNKTGGIFSQKTPSDFGLKPHMFYLQSMMFVRYLEERNRESFRTFLWSVEQGEHFSSAMENSYIEDLEGLWSDFMKNIGVAH